MYDVYKRIDAIADRLVDAIKSTTSGVDIVKNGHIGDDKKGSAVFIRHISAAPVSDESKRRPIIESTYSVEVWTTGTHDDFVKLVDKVMAGLFLDWDDALDYIIIKELGQLQTFEGVISGYKLAKINVLVRFYTNVRKY